MTEVCKVLATEVGGRVQKSWKIENWNLNHRIIAAAEVSLHVEVGDPKVALRFFLRPKERYFKNTQYHHGIQTKWYSLCAEVLTEINDNAAIEVTVVTTGDGALLSTESGAIPLNNSKGKIVEVIDQLYYFELRNADPHNCEFRLSTKYLPNVMDFSVDLQMFRFTGTGSNDVSAAKDVEKILLAEAEGSLTNDLKNLFVEHENYADLKLESKDHMTLDAHRFILAARSRYLRKYIDDAMKAEDFTGTIKMNVNGKPLVAILHWMYTGELHENAANVMEEIVDCAVLFELTQMMKVLDRKVITICNQENMFRLYQVAQKNGMPNAKDDISAYIREHL